MRKKLLFHIILLITYSSIYSQIEVDSKPYTFINSNISKVSENQVVLSPRKGIADALNEDKIDLQNGLLTDSLSLSVHQEII